MHSRDSFMCLLYRINRILQDFNLSILKHLAHPVSLLLLLALPVPAQQDPARYVNPFIGTAGHGHTFPGATLPFGMVQLSPDTRLTGWDSCSGYHYSDSIITASVTHT